MSLDPEYLPSWRDLRRRERLFWFFVLSYVYVPGILLITALTVLVDPSTVENVGAYFSVVWLAGFAGASLYRQNFRCPRCQHFFFDRFRLVKPHARKCVNCNLAYGALGQ